MILGMQWRWNPYEKIGLLPSAGLQAGGIKYISLLFYLVLQSKSEGNNPTYLILTLALLSRKLLPSPLPLISSNTSMCAMKRRWPCVAFHFYGFVHFVS